MDKKIGETALPVINNEPWYKEGLYFKCTECGNCCRGPGYVWIEKEDRKRLAQFFSLSEEAWVKKYTKQVGSDLSLTDDPQTGDCIFLKKGKECTVYSARPKQCRSFPWWPDNIKTRTQWDETKRRCEGIDHPTAPLIPLSEITKNKQNSE